MGLQSVAVISTRNVCHCPLYFASSYPSMLSTTLINTALCITQLAAHPLLLALFINDHLFSLADCTYQICQTVDDWRTIFVLISSLLYTINSKETRNAGGSVAIVSSPLSSTYFRTDWYYCTSFSPSASVDRNCPALYRAFLNLNVVVLSSYRHHIFLPLNDIDIKY